MVMRLKPNECWIWHGIGAAGLSLLGGIGSAVFSSNSSKSQINAQKEENQKNRDFNAEQASLARQYNTEMVQADRAYNDPNSVIDRLRAAGIHPALAYTQGTGINNVGVGSTGSQASANGSVGTSLPDYSGLARTGTSVASAIESIAGAQQKQALSALTAKETKWYDEVTRTGLLDTQAGIRLKGTMADLNVAERVETLQNVTNLEALYEETLARIENWDTDTLYKYRKAEAQDIDNAIRDSTMQYEIQMIKDKAKITTWQAEYAAKFFYWQMRAEQAKAHESEALADFYTQEAEKARRYIKEVLPVEFDKQTREYQWLADNTNTRMWIGLGLDVLGGMVDIANIKKLLFGTTDEEMVIDAGSSLDVNTKDRHGNKERRQSHERTTRRVRKRG